MSLYTDKPTLADRLLHRHTNTGKLIPVTELPRPKDPPFSKAARIAIIGGGPAGLTMAYELQKRGYQKVGLLATAS